MIIGIISIGYGNIGAFEDIFEDLGHEVRSISLPQQLSDLDILVLPGVGKFDSAMSELNKRGLSQRIIEIFAKGKLRILGVCLGMQLIFDSSEEGSEKGLSLLKGHFDRIKIDGRKEINMGWRSVFTSNDELIGKFYFIHNYYLKNTDSFLIPMKSKLGEIQFTAGIYSKRMLLTQFHPEKSSIYGDKLISKWLNE